MFYKIFGNQSHRETNMKVNYRVAVRAVILSDDKILMIQSNKRDYKFPGGGVEQDENHVEALLREITEETGYIDCSVGEKIGVVVERHIDDFDPNAFFQMTSHYYISTLSTLKKVDQKLDAYELNLDFRPVWVAIDEAIEQNEKLIMELQHNGWIIRENFVLKLLKKNLTHWAIN